MKKTLLLFTIAVMLVSCSNNTLSKQEASTVISSNYPTFCTSKSILSSVQFYVSDGRQMFDHKKKQYDLLKALKKKGLIKIKIQETGFKSNPDKRYYLELTDTAKKKYNGEVALTSNEFVEVVGISQNENEAIVKVKFKSVETPFYILHKEWVKKPTCYETTWEEDVTLIRFDTGWRIK